MRTELNWLYNGKVEKLKILKYKQILISIFIKYCFWLYLTNKEINKKDHYEEYKSGIKKCLDKLYTKHPDLVIQFG